ncbi:MAG: sulfite exporter TauE/SafE family protein [Porticoccaceae bacterium]|nr:sulfite exporter TauE/SafE family protein [Porticoccaceae bacterium]
MAILIGLIIGAVLGLTGAGGSIFAVPLLILLLGLAATEAMGLALGAVCAGALLGAIRQRRQILWVPAAFLATGGMLAAPFGKWIALSISELWLIVGFTVIALIIAVRMLTQASRHPESTQQLRGSGVDQAEKQSGLACRLSSTGQFQLKPKCISGLIVGGLGIGLASGMFGVGGGFLIVPLLQYLSSVSMSKGIATSLATITLISGAGFGSHLLMSGATTVPLLLYVIAGAFVGMILSQGLSKKIAGPTLQKIFALLLIAVSILLLGQFIFSAR